MATCTAPPRGVVSPVGPGTRRTPESFTEMFPGTLQHHLVPLVTSGQEVEAGQPLLRFA